MNLHFYFAWVEHLSIGCFDDRIFYRLSYRTDKLFYVLYLLENFDYNEFLKKHKLLRFQKCDFYIVLVLILTSWIANIRVNSRIIIVNPVSI